MISLWHHLGIKTDGESTYRDVIANHGSEDNPFHHAFFLNVSYYKVRLGWFSYRWVGDLRIMYGPQFERREMYIGTIAGNSQLEMWKHLKRVLLERDGVFDGTVDAITAGRPHSKAGVTGRRPRERNMAPTSST